MDSGLIKKALCFHGKPMQKIWDDERGSGDLQIMGVPEDGNYNIYMDRQKYFTFQDRAKRLKLHQFLARKAVDLYDKDLSKSLIQSIKSKEDLEKGKLRVVHMYKECWYLLFLCYAFVFFIFKKVLLYLPQKFW